LITARESITYNALRDSGLTNVSLCRDPAFSLREEPTELPPGFAAHNTVAVNVSPLVLRREPSEGILMQNLLRVMSWILSETDMHILLLPHVVMPSDNDLEPLRILEGAFRQRGCAERVCLVEENLSAAQRKYLIARCRFGIFARTHASIAAYSSNVPCLVLGYSVKSRGIGRDMGMEDYVLPISTIDKTDAVLTAFREMMAEEAQLVEVLREKNV
jgi:polysaccharide pyruvyl transferase WcaK-like protein